MGLLVMNDGTFTWRIEKVYAETPNCEVTFYQEKEGRMTVRGSTATFNVTTGLERTRWSCDSRLERRALPNRTETYQVSRSGSSIEISDGPLTWAFTAHENGFLP